MTNGVDVRWSISVSDAFLQTSRIFGAFLKRRGYFVHFVKTHGHFMKKTLLYILTTQAEK